MDLKNLILRIELAASLGVDSQQIAKWQRLGLARSLRHSIAVHLGWDASDVQDWLGHRDIASTTMIYATVTTSADKQTK